MLLLKIPIPSSDLRTVKQPRQGRADRAEEFLVFAWHDINR